MRLLGACVGLLVVFALPAPAGAFLRDFELLQPAGVAGNRANLPINCFNGKALVGMGADIHPVMSSGGLAINKMWPSDGRADQALMGSINTEPGKARWFTSGQVSCAAYTDTPPTAATGGPYLKDPVLVRKASVLSSSELRIVDADCAGRRPISGGYSLVSNPQGNPPVHVVVDRAEIVGRQFRVIAHETQPTRKRWSLEAHAVCVNYTDPVPGQVYLGPGPLTYTRTSDPISPGGAGVFAQGCPGNWVAIGAGAQVIRASPSDSPPYTVALTRLYPFAQSGSLRPTAWVAAASDEAPRVPPRSFQPSGKWRLQLKTICAPLVSASG